MPIQAHWIGRLPKWPRSAYRASAPVNASTMAPSTTNMCQPWACMKASASSGLSAARIAGCRAISTMPVPPSTRNQRAMMGPNSLPTTPVPKRCTANRPTRMAMEIGST